MESIATLVRRRAVLKRKITLYFQQVESASDCSEFPSLYSLISSQLNLVTDIDGEISDKQCELDSTSVVVSNHNREIDGQAQYNFDVAKQLLDLKLKISVESPDVLTHKSSNCELKLPNLVCGIFNGEGVSSLEYNTFLTEFNNSFRFK